MNLECLACVLDLPSHYGFSGDARIDVCWVVDMAVWFLIGLFAWSPGGLPKDLRRLLTCASASEVQERLLRFSGRLGSGAAHLCLFARIRFGSQ